MSAATLNIAIAQTNPTIGDFEGNLTAIAQNAERAMASGAHLVAFPELCLTGYYPGDLLESAAFLAKVDAAVESVKQLSTRLAGLAIVIGTPRPNLGVGKPLHNALLVIRDGRIEAEYAKQLLPTYNIFDERRHFEPGPNVACVVTVAGVRVGFMICEDGWNDEGRDYLANPFDSLRDGGAEVVVSLNASPSNIGKREQRHAIFSAAARRNGLPIVYVNQVGGQDQLVFDGASFAATPEDGVVFETDTFKESLSVIGFASGRFQALPGNPWLPGEALPKSEFYRRQIVLGLRDYARRCGFTKVVVGSSGGIDSALTLALAVEALGADNVKAITMPSVFSSEGSVSDSQALCRNLGVELHEHPIRSLVDVYSSGFASAFRTPLAGLPLENLQARIRGTILMEYSNAFGTLLLTTGNKSEISVGYCTLYGDTNGGLGLIGDLYKTEVFALSEHLNRSAGKVLIPEIIITKPPSAELAPGQQDTDSLPPYPVLDEILKWHIEDTRLPEDELDAASNAVKTLRATPEGDALVRRILGMVARNEYKRRQAPPIIRVRPRAFGTGRQMPIAARY
jgi:NAD+ synthase (glutamine-hydrolysing)